MGHRGWCQTAFIEPESPWENRYTETSTTHFCDELLNGEILYSLKEAQMVIEQWRQRYDAIRPHSSLGCRPPARETIVPPSWPPAPRRYADHPAWQRSHPCTNIQTGVRGGLIRENEFFGTDHYAISVEEIRQYAKKG